MDREQNHTSTFDGGGLGYIGQQRDLGTEDVLLQGEPRRRVDISRSPQAGCAMQGAMSR